MSDEFKNYLNSKIGKSNKNLDLLNSFFGTQELEILKQKSISVVGTNGKTSCASFLHKILMQNGISSILFTSPHLVDVNERIKLNDENISEEDISSYMNVLKNFETDNNIELAYFETLFLISSKLFLESGFDYFIVEAGIGGLYDTTSILNSDTVCITNVGYDHMDLLGDSLKDIFFQKIQVSKNPKHVIFGDPDLYQLHKNYMHENFDLNDDDIFVCQDTSDNKTNVNFETALKVFECIARYDELDTNETINKIENYSTISGRFEEVSNTPPKIIDGAHNVSSLEALISFVKNSYVISEFDVYLGMKKGKNITEFITKINSEKFKQIYLIENDSFFGQADISSYQEYLESNQISFQVASIDDFNASKNPSILTGSLYLVGKYKKEYS